MPISFNTYAKWPDGDAVGKALRMEEGQDRISLPLWTTCTRKHVDGEAGWQIYYPSTQATPSGAELVIRTTLPPATLANSVLRTLRDLNPKQPAAEFRPIQMLVDHANSPRRFFMLLVAAFAGLGLLLAALGIYGVISYSVTQRTQEIGIRMALGSGMGRVQMDVLARTLRLAVAGLVLGTVASLAVARLIASLLFDTSPWDLTTFAGMVVALVVVSALAGYIPARRASHISPMVALRAN